MTRLLPLLALTALVGCTSTRSLPGDRRGAERLHDNFGGQAVAVVQSDGTVTRGRLAGVRGDTLWVLPGGPDATRALALALAEVARVERTSARRGAIQGVYIGGAAGAMLGAPLAFKDPETVPWTLPLGIGVSALIGSRLRARDVYEVIPVSTD